MSVYTPTPGHQLSSRENCPTVSVVIVSYNTRGLTLKCLRTLYDDLGAASGQSGADFAEVWVVDNASSDGSVEAIRREFPGVHLIAAEKNLGFGAANNRAFERARGEFLFLLNSDAFVARGAVRFLAQFLQDHASVGGVGPRLLNQDGSLQVSCWKFPSPRRAWLEAFGMARVFADHPRLGDYYRWGHDAERSVDFVIGAALMVRRAVYEQVGGFDESFFLYAEETDWQKRIHAAGWDIVFTPEAQVTHLGGASGTSEREKVSNLFWEGQERYTLKHHGSAGWVVLRAAMLLGALVRALGYGVLLLTPRRRTCTPSKLRFFGLQAWRLIATRPPRRGAGASSSR